MGRGTKDLLVVLFGSKVTVGLMPNNKGEEILTQELRVYLLAKPFPGQCQGTVCWEVNVGESPEVTSTGYRLNHLV